MFNTKNLHRRAESTHETFGFIFDMDGTIVDDVHYHTLAWQKLLAERGMNRPIEEIAQNRYGTNVEIARRFLGDGIAEDEAQSISKKQESLFREIYRPNMRLIDGLKKFLDDARALGIPMALACDASLDSMHWIVENLYLESYFKVLVGAEDVERGKPSPDSLLKASLRLGLMPEECIAFDDSQSGLEAASRAGIKVFAVQPKPTGVKSTLPNVIQTITDFRTLRPALAHTYSKMISLVA